MQFSIQDKTKLNYYMTRIQSQIDQLGTFFCTRYIDLGVKIIRVQIYHPELLQVLEQQLSYTLKENSSSFDETLVVWNEINLKDLIISFGDEFNPKKNMHLRLMMLYAKWSYPDIDIMDSAFSKYIPVIRIYNGDVQFIEAHDTKNHTCYYGVSNFEPEEFIKLGHVFVQQLNHFVQYSTTNLVHGAIIGLNNNGILLCARGQRGKSTLAVHALMNGFEYVSDDYQILENNNGQIYAYPIYSIITLSPKIYGEFYNDFKGKFVSNNARKDKYVFNINNYHHQFRTHYPIKICIFPEIVEDGQPSIKLCSQEEKGRAIVQYIHSTVMQMRDLNNQEVIKKLFYMVEKLSFYKFNLSHNISQNTKYLKDFLQYFDSQQTDCIVLDKILLDITFDVAVILDTSDYRFYLMNKFATNLYECLLNGVSEAEIWKQIKPFEVKNPNLKEEFLTLIDEINHHHFMVDYHNKIKRIDIRPELAQESLYSLSLKEYASQKTIDLINFKKGNNND